MRPVPGTLSCAVARLHARKVRRNARAFRRGRAVVGPSGKAPLRLPTCARPTVVCIEPPGAEAWARARFCASQCQSSSLSLLFRTRTPTDARDRWPSPARVPHSSNRVFSLLLCRPFSKCRTSVPANAARVFQLPSDDAAAPKVLPEVYLNLKRFSESVVTVDRETTACTVCGQWTSSSNLNGQPCKCFSLETLYRVFALRQYLLRYYTINII